ncbi:hypothetical protein [Candidatus Colwellia aromaticivorans]|uniref:hypothetical protein n=1 Tax=Candidatus Colwellia aromaticivorans TaxID=2267621 RepID=UPI000DF30EF0|nr:hypothetical protein [Candidatus Colwellia aromaticivorans]
MFSLASYNAGFGHVKDAQRLARQLGLRDDKWFHNVESAMLLLQKNIIINMHDLATSVAVSR